jgi:tetratricopeptide (TPR) repeat protein
MTDALINGLAGITALAKVTARTSVIPYKRTTKSWPQIAKELGVDALVESSVTRSGGRVGINARLFEGRQGQQVGMPITIEREETDVLALQSELVQKLVREIKVQVTPQEARRLAVARAIDPEVYDATLQGKALVESMTREAEARRAIALFQKAVDRDPNYALAWAGLGEAYWYLAVAGFEVVPPAEVRGKAIEAAEKALELDETLPEAHMARAVIALDGEWDLVKAQRHFERALDLRPSYASAHTFYGQMLANPLLRFDEARRHLDRARELDPLVPWNDANLLVWWQIQGQPGKALEEGERARLRNPRGWLIRDMIGDAQLLLGQPSQAAREYEAALALLSPDRPATVLAVLGLAYGLAGRQGEALKILTEMEQASGERYVSPLFLAVANSGIGRMDEAFRLLDRALELRVPYLVGLTPYSDMVFALRRDSRWKPFAERLRRSVKLPAGTLNPYS